MSKKNLLNESTVRRFMKLAEMSPLASSFVKENYPPMADDDEPTPEEAEFDAAYEEEGEEEGFEAGEAAEEEDLGVELEDDPIDAEGDLGAEGELTLTDEEAEVFLKVADKVRAAMEAGGEAEEMEAPDMGGDEEMDMDAEVEMDAEVDMDAEGGDIDVEEEEEIELQETGAKRTGASKGDKGKDPKDPSAKDYTDEGDREGDESETHKGDKDYTTKKGTKLKHSGKGRGEKKGDKAYINEDLVNEIARRVAQKVLRAKTK